MKKVLFIMPAMRIGGSAVSLMNLLALLQEEEKIKIELFLMQSGGALYEQIKNEDYLLPANKRLDSCLCLKADLRKKHGMVGVVYRINYVFKQKLLGTKQAIEKEYILAAEELSGRYDVVIAFQEDMATRFAQYINAPRKIAWVHNDYRKIYGNQDINQVKQMYAAFDSVVCVSKASQRSFIEAGVVAESKTQVIYNSMNISRIIEKSNEYNEEKKSDKKYRLVSVGRFASQKAFERIPNVAKKLLDEGISFEWIVVGDGDLLQTVKECIDLYGVSDVVKLVGAKTNPYPFIKSADILVVTSLYEAHPMVANEALILHKPVISTEFSSVREVIIDGENGIIVENSEKGLVSGLIEVLTKTEFLERLQKEVLGFTYRNEEIVNQVMSLVR